MMFLQYTALVVALQLAVAFSARSQKPWDELIFAQTWPASFCVQIQIQKTHVCNIPNNVTTWAVHGLWPTEDGAMGPNYCNKSDKFDPTKLAPIRDQLLKYWANLFEDEHAEQFWSHEWQKHGTCAENLGTLDTELKYFSTGLKMNRQIDLMKILAQGGISPSDSDTYKLADLENTLKTGLGVLPKLQCFLSEDKSRQYLVQLEVCLDKEFNVIECKKKDRKSNSIPSFEMDVNSVPVRPQRLRRSSRSAQNEPCNDARPITYPVIKH